MTLIRFLQRDALTPRQRRRVEDRIRRWLRYAVEAAEFIGLPEPAVADLRRAAERAQARIEHHRTVTGA
ncbi:MAG: hypothetical protein KF683_00905 [Rubrivivax sp.]|nr:hypothetical protein [Rubrivivax sp.]